MALQPRDMLGPYRIIEQGGQSGVATVYWAFQPALSRHVAIKVLSALSSSATPPTTAATYM